jgi:hypothetical protein
MRESGETKFSVVINWNFMWKLFTGTIKIKIKIEIFKNKKIDD